MVSIGDISQEPIEGTTSPEVIRDSKIVFVSELVQVCLGLGVLGILAHDLSTERFGFWVSVLAIFQLLSFADFGFSTIVARKIPESETCNKSLMALVRRTQVVIVVLLLPICLILLGIFFQNEDLFSPPVYLLGAATLSISCTNVNRSFLRTVGLSFNEVKISLVDRSATLLLLLIARSISNANEFYYLVAYIAGPLLGLYYSFRLVNMELIRIPASEEKLTVGKLVGESVPFAIDSVLIPLSEALTRIIILSISGAVMVAIFEIAWRVYVGGSAIVRSIRKSMLSAFSSNQFNDAELEKSLRSSSKLTYWLLPIGLFSGVIGGSLIPVVFSEDYVDSIPVFSVLLGTWAIMLIGSGYQVAVQSLQSGRRYLLLTGIGAMVQVISALFLVGEFGAMGAAISVFIGQVTMVSTSFILTLQMGPFGGSWRLLVPCSVLSAIFVSISWILEVEAWDGEFIISCISILLLIGIITGWRPEIPSMTSEN